MLKNILMIGSVMVAAPALAQDATPGAATSAEAATAQGQTATGAQTTAQESQTAGEATAANDARSQVAQLVDSEWSMYDTNNNLVLELGEFSAWLTKLRQQSVPDFDGTTQESQQWLAAAFDFADKDDTSSVSKPELVTLLTPAPEESSAGTSSDTGTQSSATDTGAADQPTS